MAAQVEPPTVTLVGRTQSADEGFAFDDDGSRAELTELPRRGKPTRTPTQNDEGPGRCISLSHADDFSSRRLDRISRAGLH
jgi:hypothetical protein